MKKNEIGKTAGISGAVALIVTIVCQMFHSGGVP
tara:strand:+ start:173 stop:274 length:102 start_codon:yes stop_codon:yes gene_type:complete